jgi:hypothetical protein
MTKLPSTRRFYLAIAGVLGLAALGAVNLAQAADPYFPNLREGMPFAEARQNLFGSGWQGVRKDPAPGHSGVVGHVFYDLGFTEVIDCAGTGEAPCIFLYRNGEGRELELHTRGEENLVLHHWNYK